MVKIFKVLIADDEEDIVEILSFIIKSSLKCEVVTAQDGKKAVELLSRGDIDLIVCDYNMPFIKGGDVYKYILESFPSCKYVLCSTDSPEQHEAFQDQSSFYGFIEKPNLVTGLKIILDRAKKEFSLVPVPEMESYAPVSPVLLYKISLLPSDVALKLSEKKYVKVFNKGAVFDESDLVKYTMTDSDKLYAVNASAEDYINGISLAIHKIAKNLDSHNAIEGNQQIHSLLTSAFKEYGVRQSMLTLIDLQIKEAFNLCNSNKALSLLLDKLLRTKGSYLGKHSFMLAAVSVALAEKMEWNSATTSHKLVMASMFHDIYLKETFTSEMINVAVEQRDQDFLSHPQKAAELLDTIPHVPPDTSRIILEHHEVGNDDGFHRGIPISKTTPLSQLFTFSHYVVDVILETPISSELDRKQFYMILEKLCQRSKKYEKLLEVFRSLNFFES